MPANYIEEQPEITAGPEAVFYWSVPAAREPDDVQHVISHYLEGLETPPEPKEFAKQLGYILPFLPELGRRPIRGKDGGEAVSRWTHSRVAACLAGVLHKLYPRQQAACYEPVIQRLEALASTPHPVEEAAGLRLDLGLSFNKWEELCKATGGRLPGRTQLVTQIREDVLGGGAKVCGGDGAVMDVTTIMRADLRRRYSGKEWPERVIWKIGFDAATFPESAGTYTTRTLFGGIVIDPRHLSQGNNTNYFQAYCTFPKGHETQWLDRYATQTFADIEKLVRTGLDVDGHLVAFELVVVGDLIALQGVCGIPQTPNTHQFCPWCVVTRSPSDYTQTTVKRERTLQGLHDGQEVPARLTCIRPRWGISVPLLHFGTNIAGAVTKILMAFFLGRPDPEDQLGDGNDTVEAGKKQVQDDSPKSPSAQAFAEYMASHGARLGLGPCAMTGHRAQWVFTHIESLCEAAKGFTADERRSLVRIVGRFERIWRTVRSSNHEGFQTWAAVADELLTFVEEYKKFVGPDGPKPLYLHVAAELVVQLRELDKGTGTGTINEDHIGWRSEQWLENAIGKAKRFARAGAWQPANAQRQMHLSVQLLDAFNADDESSDGSGLDEPEENEAHGTGPDIDTPIGHRTRHAEAQASYVGSASLDTADIVSLPPYKHRKSRKKRARQSEPGEEDREEEPMGDKGGKDAKEGPTLQQREHPKAAVTPAASTPAMQTAAMQTAARQTAARQTAAMQTAAMQTAAMQTAAMQTAAMQTAAMQTAAMQTAAMQTQAMQTQAMQAQAMQAQAMQAQAMQAQAMQTPAMQTPAMLMPHQACVLPRPDYMAWYAQFMPFFAYR
ncbi:hypothetical protein PAPYR_11238 [Paratrimastix pyriformis]|uniref:Uncharacterized protein n=1 Tax=Paratrimastix pyriformis TaxID=342808 RepID=A0ABQ8U991_9EUKA|nr:hypothetical protein PAPYR_11238 [Paratrimastix pyriformis]